MPEAPRLILASLSASRKAMLAGAAVPFEATPSQVDEAALKVGFSGPPAALASTLALAKAQAVSSQQPDALVIGGDQLLVCGGKIYDKPRDLPEAATHLRTLSGQTHELVTAVCLVQGGAPVWTHVESAHLSMRRFSEDFLQAYLAAEAGEILHCVGAYRLEGPGAQLFTRVEGDYFTVLGLPLLALLGALRERGVLAA
ncbi:Maf family protein [Acidocella aminolytica]|uniref:Nucleoside triphosphate pyrophosphatase n=1 Tax=Acidocella aminolytica 101 = DSM 11237 TaxID=1120923 RepID=A0A0D6PEU9_9PROT|nr:nucleoside triphosphate pyrophosphatase [Acidocella aminolytica]GAN79891.1 cell division inhibitor/septum formation inhibitor nucleotide-binding protein Maf [Acidocella aminolytica 101 = DSM 11237]GBQ40998.1 septum formation inhibitor nucleotide-binding protein Maf [Acidocella aminolytica 101 = DSM 11237]